MTVIEIDVTEGDRVAGGLSDDAQQAAVSALRGDGFVLLNDVVNPAHLDVLHDRMVGDLDALQARADAPYNWNAGNLQQDPPPFPPYLFADVLLNPFVIAVTSALLGPTIKNVMYGGNTALPGDQRQPVHADSGHLWPLDVLDAPHPSAQLVVNVSTVDVSPENGATEIWPGTHRELSVGAGNDIKVAPDALERRRAICPPLQPTFRRGSMLIRDIRLWHAGMPNRTAVPRPMIAMIHTSSWLDTGTPLTFPSGTEQFFEHETLATAATFTSDPIDYLNGPTGHEFEPQQGDRD